MLTLQQESIWYSLRKGQGTTRPPHFTKATYWLIAETSSQAFWLQNPFTSGPLNHHTTLWQTVQENSASSKSFQDVSQGKGHWRQVVHCRGERTDTHAKDAKRKYEHSQSAQLWERTDEEKDYTVNKGMLRQRKAALGKHWAGRAWLLGRAPARMSAPQHFEDTQFLKLVIFHSDLSSNILCSLYTWQV